MIRQKEAAVRRRLAALVAACLGSAAGSAWATVFVYTPANTATNVWSAGTNWSPGAPVSSATTELTFVGTNTDVIASGLTNTNTDDIAGAFSLNIMDLQGTGPATGGTAATITIAAAGGSNLNFVANGATNPTVNLNANLGTLAAGLAYNVAAPVTLANDTTLAGAGTAGFSFTGVVSGSGALHQDRH